MNSESLGRLAQFVIRSAWAAFGVTVTDPDTFDTSNKARHIMKESLL